MIHYHGTPLGGPTQDHIRFLHSRHALVSFAYMDDLGAVAEACQSFVFDNGAFTAWKSGKEIDRKAYYTWVEEWCQHPGFDWTLVPDVIDGTERDNNLMIAEWPTHLRKFGVPVYHMHESLDRLEMLVKTKPRVAIGSSGDYPTPGAKVWWDRINDIMKVCCDSKGRPRTRLHGLRMLNPKVFTKLPLASADSTNAATKVNLVQDRFGTYKPPKGWQRAAVVADRCEAHNSSATWGGTGFSYENCTLCEEYE